MANPSSLGPYLWRRSFFTKAHDRVNPRRSLHLPALIYRFDVRFVVDDRAAPDGTGTPEFSVRQSPDDRHDRPDVSSPRTGSARD